MDIFLQLTINGLLLGALYAAMTLGFSIIWGVMRLINLAHGEFLLMGAYVAWFFFNPTREQSLIIGGGDPLEVAPTTRLLFVGGAFMIAFVMSEVVLRERFPENWRRRALSFGGVGAAALVVYLLWRSADFRAFELPVKEMVLFGTAGSLGLLLSHFVLSEAALQLRGAEGGAVNLGNMLGHIWVRRVIGYGIAAAAIWIFHERWRAGDFQPIDPFAALPMIIILFFGLGYVLQKLLFNRLVEGPYLTMLLVTFAVKIFLINVGLRIYAADPRRINTTYALESWNLSGDLTVTKIRFYVLLLVILTVALLLVFLNRTRVGYAIRAAAQHKMAARLMGINIKETYAITFGIALAITGMVGALMGNLVAITPVTGDPWTLRAFAIVALGGLGRMQGVVMGGIVLGVVESYIGGYFDTGWAVTAAFLILVLMLLLRPQGIAGGLQAEES